MNEQTYYVAATATTASGWYPIPRVINCDVCGEIIGWKNSGHICDKCIKFRKELDEILNID